jgi:hypothetical protein
MTELADLTKWHLANGYSQAEFDELGPEKRYYEPTKQFLETLLKEHGCDKINLEITDYSNPSAVLKTYLGDELELDKTFAPDLCGIYHQNNDEKLIVVEVKPKPPTIRDIYQTLCYYDLCNADIGILITPFCMDVQKRNYLKNHEELLIRDGDDFCNRNIFIGTISVKEGKFLEDRWLPQSPSF